MTPAIKTLKNHQIDHTLHSYELSGMGPGGSGDLTYGEAVALAVGFEPARVFKTLVAQLNTSDLVNAVVPVCATLDLRALARAAGAKNAKLAPPRDAERATGYVTGGISPFGQRKRLPTFVDASVYEHQTVLVSAGKRGLQLEVRPADLVEQTNARTAALTQ